LRFPTGVGAWLARLGWWAENQLPRQFSEHGRALWGFVGTAVQAA